MLAEKSFGGIVIVWRRDKVKSTPRCRRQTKLRQEGAQMCQLGSRALTHTKLGQKNRADLARQRIASRDVTVGRSHDLVPGFEERRRKVLRRSDCQGFLMSFGCAMPIAAECSLRLVLLG